MTPERATTPSHPASTGPTTASGPVMECGCGYADCTACAGDGWACLRCGLAFFWTSPEHGLCPTCHGEGAPA